MDIELVQQARDGDADAFAAVMAASADRMYGIAFRILRDHDRAEDALQQALVDMWEDIPGLRDPAKFTAWADRLVVHASYREARRERRWTSRVRQITVDLPGEDRAPGIADREELEGLFRRLTPEHRAVIVLHYYLGLPLADVAATLGIPDGTAKSRLHYAVRSLRAAFEADARSVIPGRTTA